MWIHNYESIRQTIQRSPCSPYFTVQKMATRNALFSRPWASEENPPEDMLVKQGAEKSSVGKKMWFKDASKDKEKTESLLPTRLWRLVFFGMGECLTPSDPVRNLSVGVPRPVINSTRMTSAWPTSIPKGPKIHVVRTPKKTRKTSSQFLRSRYRKESLQLVLLRLWE